MLVLLTAFSIAVLRPPAVGYECAIGKRRMHELDGTFGSFSRSSPKNRRESRPQVPLEIVFCEELARHFRNHDRPDAQHEDRLSASKCIKGCGTTIQYYTYIWNHLEFRAIYVDAFRIDIYMHISHSYMYNYSLYICICTYINIYIYIYIYVHTYINTHARAHMTHTHIYIYMYINIYTYFASFPALDRNTVNLVSFRCIALYCSVSFWVIAIGHGTGHPRRWPPLSDLRLDKFAGGHLGMVTSSV